MSKQKEEVMSVRILPNTTSNPPGKLADAEVIVFRKTVCSSSTNGTRHSRRTTKMRWLG
jgi:hypothetical protein